MELDADILKVYRKKQNRWMPIIFTALIAGIIPIVVAGCARPLEKLDRQSSFEQWLQKDKEIYSGRQSDFHRKVQEPQKTEQFPALPESPTFDDLVRYAMQHNPDLEAAFFRWRAAIERVPQAITLPDPQVSFGIVIDQVEKSAEYMGERYSISQMFPWFGKLKIRGDMALKEAYAEERRFEAVRFQLIERLGRAYFEYAYIHRAIAIARENLDLLIRLESVVRAMFRAGTASLSDVNRAQVEIGRVEDQVRSLEDIVGVAIAELNVILGRPAHAYLPPPVVDISLQMTDDPTDYSDEHWILLAKENNPEIAATRHDASRQRHAIELTQKDFYPDIMIGIEYDRDASARIAMMDDGGSDMLSLMVSFNLPIRREKYNAGAREMTARAVETSQQLRSRENNLETDLKRALYFYRDSRRKLELYGGTLLPKAYQSLAITEAAYRAGDTGFSDLIDAQRALLEFALANERAAADCAQAYIRVQALSGYHPGPVIEQVSPE